MNRHPQDLDGKVALVTGVDDALGAWLARTLEADGATVVGLEAEPLVADPASIPAAVAAALEPVGGGLDVLVNHVGMRPVDGPLRTIDAGAWNAAIERQSTTALFCTQTVAPLMQARGGGRVLNLSSTLAQLSDTPHGISSLLVQGLTVGFARELAPAGITVNAIVRGPMADEPAIVSDDELARRSALGTTGRPDDLLGAIRLLVTDAGGWITGQMLHVNGGFWMRPA